MLRTSVGSAWRRVAAPLCAARPNPPRGLAGRDAWSVRAFSAGHDTGNANWMSNKLQKKVAKLRMVDKVRKAAEAGESEAMTLMGAACAMGNQVPTDETEAGRWFLAAAKAGCQTGALAAGIWLLEGRGGLEASAEAAAPHLKVAADHGISRGQTMLGILTLEGTGVEKNAAAAAKLFEKASADNDHIATYNLGVLFQTGRGVAKNPGKGAPMIRKAAVAGVPEAQFTISQWYGGGVERGDVKQVDLRKQFEWCLKAAKQGHVAAQHNAGVALMDGTGIDSDPAQAVDWYRKAALGGSLEAKCNLGMCFIQATGVAEDKLEGVALVRTAAEAGYDLAQFNLAVCLGTGLCGAPDEPQSVEWLRKSADQAFVPAMEQLATALRDGRGCAENTLEADAWEAKVARAR